MLKETNLRIAFNKFDSDGSGAISVDEIIDVLGLTHSRKSHKETTELINEIDIDGNGEICFEEFKQMMIKI